MNITQFEKDIAMGLGEEQGVIWFSYDCGAVRIHTPYYYMSFAFINELKPVIDKYGYELLGVYAYRNSRLTIEIVKKSD